MPRILTGIQPSGNIHLGNYLGAIQPALSWQKKAECFYFVPDLHALNSTKDPNILRSQILDVAATWLALGFDSDKHALYVQSAIPEVTELTWRLGCVTGMGFLEKAHVHKDAQAKGLEINHGVFAYPILMAADILLYDAELVPVGKDQKQHVEMARDIAGSFNSIYGEVLKLPQAIIEERVMTIPGLDGRKMSKSYQNEIPLFASREVLRKKVMSIKTDSSPLEAPKDMLASLVGQLLQFFTTETEFTQLNQSMAQGGLGWGHAKEALLEAIDSHVAESRRAYNSIREDEKLLIQKLSQGNDKVRSIAVATMERVRRASGSVLFPAK